VRGPASAGSQRLNGTPRPWPVDLAAVVTEHIGELACLEWAVTNRLEHIDIGAEAASRMLAWAEQREL